MPSVSPKKAIAHLERADPILAAIIARVGPYRIQYSEPRFESLVRSIIYQQLSGKVAAVIFGRVVAATGTPMRPSAVQKLGTEKLRSLGLSGQKASYVLDLASKARTIRFPELPELSDEAVIERLTAVKGIGVWTAHMFLMFSLRRPNVLPTLDLGIRMAIKKAHGMESLPSPKEVAAIGEVWQPWCTVASWYLWRSLELPPETAEE